MVKRLTGVGMRGSSKLPSGGEWTGGLLGVRGKLSG